MTRLIAIAAFLTAGVAAASAAAAIAPVVPLHSQQAIKKRTNLYAFVPTRVGFGYRYYAWKFQPGAKPAMRIWFRNKLQRSREITFVVSPQAGPCAQGKEKSFQLDGNKVYWSQSANEQQAWRCLSSPVNGKLIRLTAATSMSPRTFADVGLGRIVASGRWVR
jgi:hypothetical protein